MSISSEITRINGNIAAAYTAANNKGATMPATQNSANLATCIGTISTGGGSAKYKLYDRVKDDNNNEIGTVSGFYTDSNDNEYAVVCLDAQYRLAAGAWSSTAGTATNMPLYANYTNIAIWGDGVESATTNTQLILDWCTAQGYTSTACEHCRSKYFTIDGTTYYGQLPNISELLDIFRNHHRLEDADTSSSSAGTTLNWATDWKSILASNQVSNAKAWFINNVGSTSVYSLPGLAKATNALICPVLEIPNT